MAARNAKKREKFAAPEPASKPKTITVDEWVPDYDRKCEFCGQTPCVTGVLNGKTVYHGSACGVCTWGDPDAIDPANW
jgi:hypothetical protein